MARRLSPRLAALAFLVFPAVLSAQDTRPMVGERIRLHRTASPAVEGILTGVEPDAWTVAVPGGGTVAVAPDEVVRADRWETRRRWLRGALIGGGVGLLLGAAVVATDDSDTLASYGLQPAILGTFTLTGAAGGALIGALVRTGRWTPTLLPAEVGTGGFGLGWTVSVPF